MSHGFPSRQTRGVCAENLRQSKTLSRRCVGEPTKAYLGVDCPVYGRNSLAIVDPAIIEQRDTTCLIDGGFRPREAAPLELPQLALWRGAIWSGERGKAISTKWLTRLSEPQSKGLPT